MASHCDTKSRHYLRPNNGGDNVDSTASQYAAEGFLGPLDVLTQEETADALADFKAWRSALPGGSVTGDLRFKPHLHLPFAARIAFHPSIVNAVRSALGTNDVLLWSSDFNVKPPESGGYFPLHQDATYSGLAPAEQCLTVWVALSDPVDEEHGCLSFILGTHKLGQLTHVEGGCSADDDDPANGTCQGSPALGQPHNMLSRGQRVADEGGTLVGTTTSRWWRGEKKDEVIMELRGGQASIHHFHLLHRSGPNRASTERVGLALRYIAASVRQTRSVAKECVTIVSGSAQHDGYDFEPRLLLPPTGGDNDAADEAEMALAKRRARGLAVHAESMRRESANYFEGSENKGYDEMVTRENASPT